MPWKKLEECTITTFVERPIRSQDPARGIPVQNKVMTRPIIDDTQPPAKEPMMCPNKNMVAEDKYQLYTDLE